VYHFELVAWDGEQETRVYGFVEVSASSYESIQRLTMTPPPAAEYQERSNAVALATRDALASAFERRLFMAAVDLTKEIKGARVMTFSDWANLMGLVFAQR
jgi:hypothetical protein